MAEQFADFILQERDRLNGEREAIFNEQRELQTQLDTINNEMRAIDAYEAAKAGKAPSAKAPATRVRRGRRGSKREELLAVIRDNAGLSRGEILEKMGLKGNKSGEMSVSNALTSLTKSGQVSRDGGKYRIAA
jgi:hypothetical protein